ncbi:hypothetical protein LPJ53_003493 [Coemansia erecta]|uniref:F-box domain-containing protein n=1 Tax=Coemansia erecta TaxID=147472 RepID=A0A9W7XW55_9FUNG|nr:hypothetical protein LPJ53_003493 [Coemansia erecta]
MVRFVKHLVDVRYMSFENQDMRVIPHSFASALVEAYSRNMNYLYCGNVVFPRAIVHLSGALTNLRIDFSGVSIDYFPSVISESLEELTLLELPDTFSMSHFAHHDQTRHIHFSNLKWLTLKYRQTDMEFDQAVFSQISNTKSHLYYKIQAPKLKVLILEHITPHCDMLYSLNGLRLETFYFTGKSVSVATLLRLLSRLDNLTNLHVYNVTTNEAMDMIFENDMRVLAGMAPRSTRLISMYIKRQATHDALSHSQMMYIVKFLMANTPSLQRLGVLDEIMAEVKTFAEANSQHHPHLSGVRIFSAWPH